MKRSLISLLTFAFIFSSCLTKDKDPGPSLFGNLYVRYLQDGNQIKAEASFFEGDSAQTATPVSILGGVSFQGSGMESRNLQNKLIRYQYENTGEFPGKFTFQAQDSDGTPYSFQLEMLPVSSFSMPDTILTTEGFDLEILPAPGPKAEAIAILFTDTTGKASLVEIPAPISQKNFIAPGKMASLSPGPNQVYLVKKQHTTLQNGRFRIKGDVEFYTVVKEVAIFD